MTRYSMIMRVILCIIAYGYIDLTIHKRLLEFPICAGVFFLGRGCARKRRRPTEMSSFGYFSLPHWSRRIPTMTALQTRKSQLEPRFISEIQEHVKGICVI